ncbi:transporter [Streptomyces sp. F-3]|jgi:anti-sigma regulatory factor (Ser/Thr protein kinase)|uniref:Histidine kinase/HSP90-like ATPase domain-containing protein n=1 Tax=Streptomyces thermogriseus TaxID=75292 RepID=A0ABN1STF1_9ACTN|nr:ATP-binding protein [Streptomyces sp. F-3]GAT82304.1 transporter [Streptomyces sp. F-3]
MSTAALHDTMQPSAVTGRAVPRRRGPVGPRPGLVRDRTRPAARPAPGRHAVLALPAEVRWVPVARRSATAILAHWRLHPADLASAELVIGELAANAAVHGRRDMTLRLSLDAKVLRISVTDSGGPARSRRPYDDDPDEHGRGLAIVGLLAGEVRVHPSPLGRRVSVVLPTGLPR